VFLLRALLASYAKQGSLTRLRLAPDCVFLSQPLMLHISSIFPTTNRAKARSIRLVLRGHSENQR